MSKFNPHHDISMFKGARPQTFAKAKSLRRKMTKAEIVLWEELKTKKLNNLKFRRQHPIHHFIADFYCHELSLIIEIDGGYHNNKEQREYDIQREKLLKFQDVRIIRFTNEEVLNNIEKIKQQILIEAERIEKQTP